MAQFANSIMRLIGIYGGTFNPIHFGHLRPALEACHQLSFDHVRVIPCFKAVHKAQPSISVEHRCKMVGLALQEYSEFELDLFEVEKGGPSYMVETLQAKKQQFPRESLVLIMGTDSFAKFTRWYQWQTILTLANILILHRPGDAMAFEGEEDRLWRARRVERFDKESGQLSELAVTQLDISSTQIRNLLKNGESADFLVPESVAAHIKKHQLYHTN